ncbi:MAG: hypothetical protein V4710_21205 [Verrucomicrobiota bacterium]
MMPRTPHPLFAAAVFLAFSLSAWADGFHLTRALENKPHIVMQLSPAQVAVVGRERKLVLTEDQRETLSQFMKKVPRVLGVESLGEPDCSCHLSSALWTATSEVTIWVNQLAHDADGSKFYHEVRRKRGHYTANANGEIFASGRPVSWSAFEAAVRGKKDGNYIQLSRPPTEPKHFTIRLRELQARAHFNSRL